MIRSALPFLAVLLAAAAPPSTFQVQPGRWQYAVTIVDAQMPGMPGGGAMMRGHTTNASYCITPADAAHGPQAVFERSGGHCRMTRWNQNGSNISSSMSCDRGMTMNSTGSYTPTSIDANGQMTGPNGLRITSRVTGRRVGAC